MKYHGEYEVDPAFIEGGSVKWRLTGNGEYILGTKGGRKYFIKRNMHLRYPSKDEPKAVYEKYKAEAEAVTRRQTALRKKMSGLTCDGDGIVFEEESFWDEEKMFTTVTRFIADGLPDKYDYGSLSLPQFLELCKKTAEEVGKLHARGVIHGDLKEKNIVVVKKGENYMPYLIDFDASYLSSDIPEWDSVSGTDGYFSPEVLLYSSDEGASDGKDITCATDIFTLGIVMHRWWTGSFPTFDMEKGSVGAAVYLGKEVTLNGKFDVKTGKKHGATLMSLINWMLAKDPAARPAARQVAEVLSDGAEVPEAFHRGSDEKPFDRELWTAHRLVAELSEIAALKAKGVKSFKRVNTGCGSTGLKYKVVTDGGERILSVGEIVTEGYAKRVEAQVDAPWDGHMIEFVSPEKISEMGYAKIVRTLISFRKRYLVTTSTGREFDKGWEWLVTEGLAKPKIYDVVSDAPWGEHGTRYVPENMAKLGVISISRVEVGGEHRYRLVYNEIIDGKNKVNEKVSANNLKIMGFIK